MSFKHEIVIVFSFAMVITVIVGVLDCHFSINNLGVKAGINLMLVTLVGFLLKRSIEVNRDERALYVKAVKNYNALKLLRRKLQIKPFKSSGFDELFAAIREFELIQLEFEEIRDALKINKSLFWSKNRKSIIKIFEDIEQDLRCCTKYLDKESKESTKWEEPDRKKIFEPFYTRLTADKDEKIKFFGLWNKFQLVAYKLKKID